MVWDILTGSIKVSFRMEKLVSSYSLQNICRFNISAISLHADIWFLPPASAVEVIESVLSVCLWVCPSVSTLTTKSFEVRTRNFACVLTWTISRSSSRVKVIGQRSKPPGEKMWCWGNSTDFFLIWKSWYKTLVVMSGRLMMPQLEFTPSCDVTKWCHLGKMTLRHWRYVNAQVFFWYIQNIISKLVLHPNTLIQ